MNSNWVATIATLAVLTMNATAQQTITSPDGRIAVTCALTPAGELTYAVTLAGQPVLEPSPLGLAAECGTWTSGLRWVDATPITRVSDDYQLLHGKRRNCHYVANRCTVTVRNAAGQLLNVVWQVSDDGVAFRYEVPACGDATGATIKREATGFDFPADARAWLMPMDVRGGWKDVNPCYEAFYHTDAPVTLASPTGVGWAFPALFHVHDTAWVLISESDVDGRYCASRLSSPTDAGLYRIEFPDPRENNHIGAPEPAVTFPFQSPWRVIIIGQGLKTLVESTLVDDVATPAKIADASFVKPGKATWSWLREKDSATVYDRQRAYVDLAARLGFEYCLVDALWDTQIGYDKIAELTRYANEHHVGILLWYNTNGQWNDAPQTPKDRMDTHDARVAEFKRIRDLGVKGVKVDFFGGDKQTTMQLYHDIIADAAEFGLLVNCHGATIPRGWERTWSNLVSMEAVRGYENYTFQQADADRAGPHCCMVPFTRNVVGPMDFTPTCLGKSLDTGHKIERRTTQGFELAMSVVFESGIQHFGLTPDDIAAAPGFVLAFLRALPATWEDTHFVAGYPAEFIVLARRSGTRWFVAGMNGSDTPREMTCDLSFIGQTVRGTLIEDCDDPQTLKSRTITRDNGTPLKLTLPACGGFVFYTAD